MATVYNLEPQPTAKAILHTTYGPLTLELFASQTPLTTRNFLQHLLDGYYTNTIFHRLIPGFILQGGDPTGTGHGGQSSYDGGAPFADEFHSRLKFNRRGLLGMANGGAKDDNGSQFFLTLGKAEELNGRHTMFGRVASEDNTIFNLVKMGEAEVEEGTERPMYPVRVTGAEVLVNPFEGMVKREHVAVPRTAGQKQEAGKKKAKKTKGKSLLSFAGGEEDAEEGVVPVKVAKFNPKLVNTVEDTDSVPEKSTSTKRAAPAPPPAERAPKRRAPSPPPSPPPAPSTSAPTPKPQATHAHLPSSSSPSPSPPPPNHNASALALANAQIAALKASLKRDIPTTTASTSKPKSALEAMIPLTSTRGRKRKGGGAASGAAVSREEQAMLESFEAFRRKLDAASTTAARDTDAKGAGDGKVQVGDQADAVPGDRRALDEIDGRGTHTDVTTTDTAPPQAPVEPASANADDDEATLCDLHFIANCQSCARWADEDGGIDGADGDNRSRGDRLHDDDAGGSGWLSHRLTFEKDRLGKDLKWKEQNEKELVVIDPRERERELGVRGGSGRDRERGKGGGGREWDRRERQGDRGRDDRDRRR